MRVITGTARGRRLKTLEGNDVRPTTDKVKEAIFSSIQFDLPAAAVLDLFAGSGQMGIEALSRGAKAAVFVDSAKSSIGVIADNIEAVGFIDMSKIVSSDSLAYLRGCKESFDIAFLDPPYSKGLIEKSLELLEPKMSGRGIVVCEHEVGLVLPERIGRLVLRRCKKYGKVIEVTIYDIKEDESE